MQKVKITLSDGYSIEVPRKAAESSTLFVDMLVDDDSEYDPENPPEIPIQFLDKQTLDLIALFIEKHMDNPMVEIEKPIKTNNINEIVDEWDANLVEIADDENKEPFLNLIKAANYLHISSLLDLCILKLACMIKDKDQEQVCTIFNINKPTHAQELDIQEKNKWLFAVTNVTDTTTQVQHNDTWTPSL